MGTLYNKFSTTVKTSKLTHLLTTCCNEQTSTYNELTNGEVNISHENTTMVAWIYDCV